MRLARARRLGWLAALALAGLGGCFENDALCDLRPAEPRCVDWRRAPTADWTGPKDFCQAQALRLGSALFDAPNVCGGDGLLGGCRSVATDGTVMTGWYYQSAAYPSVAKVKAACDPATTFQLPE